MRKKIAVIFMTLILLLAFSACQKQETLPVDDEVSKVDTVMENMSIEDKVGQLFAVRPESLGEGASMTELTDSM